jgi:glycosyltransferase involved in cell wall biosynthesis
MIYEEKNDNILVTFVVFAFNQETYIREAIEGAFSQTYNPLEIILSDDCSTDKTHQIMRDMAEAYNGPHEVIVRRNYSNLGFSDHINNVIYVCSGDYVVWAAGDDISLPLRVESLIYPCLKKPNIIGTYSDIEEIDLMSRSSGKIRRKSHQKNHPSIMDVIFRRFSVNTQSYCFNKEVFQRYPKLNSDLTYEAPCMTLRALLAGNVEYVPKITVKYRIGSGVSTYSGQEKDKIKVHEPVKIAEWRRSSAKQMLDDLNFFDSDGFVKQKRVLRKIIRGSLRLREINEQPFQIYLTILNVFSLNYALESLRALFRRNIPFFLWKLIKRKYTL